MIVYYKFSYLRSFDNIFFRLVLNSEKSYGVYSDGSVCSSHRLLTRNMEESSQINILIKCTVKDNPLIYSKDRITRIMGFDIIESQVYD